MSDYLTYSLLLLPVKEVKRVLNIYSFRLGTCIIDLTSCLKE